MRIDNRDQLKLLHLRFAQVDGAFASAAAAQRTAEDYARQYMESLSMVLGITFAPGQRVNVNWDTGDVELGESAGLVSNGVAVP